LPERYGPRTTVNNRFNRWRKASVWNRILDAIIVAYDGKVQMIDTSCVRVHQHAGAAEKMEYRSLYGVFERWTDTAAPKY
jgi:transposase